MEKKLDSVPVAKARLNLAFSEETDAGKKDAKDKQVKEEAAESARLLPSKRFLVDLFLALAFL